MARRGSDGFWRYTIDNAVASVGPEAPGLPAHTHCHTVAESTPSHVHTTTGLAARDTFVSNADRQRVPVHLSIDKLARTGDEVRLEWTVENYSSHGEQADLVSLLGGEGAWDVQGIALAPSGSGKSLHPYVEDGSCFCTYWGSYANAVDAGESLLFHAVFRGIPADATKADIDLLGLGRFEAVPIEGAP